VKLGETSLASMQHRWICRCVHSEELPSARIVLAGVKFAANCPAKLMAEIASAIRSRSGRADAIDPAHEALLADSVGLALSWYSKH
jgi:hypothetical protein